MKKILKSKQAQYIGLALFFILLFVLLMLGYREAIKMSTNNSPSNGTSYPVSLPESVSERPTLVPTVKVKRPTGKDKPVTLKRYNVASIQELINKHHAVDPEDENLTDLQVKFPYSKDKLHSSLTSIPCQIEKFGIILYIPQSVLCESFSEQKGDTWAYISIPKSFYKGNIAETGIGVLIYNLSEPLKEFVPQASITGPKELSIGEFSGYEAYQYYENGGGGTIFRMAEVKLDENTVIVFRFLIKEDENHEHRNFNFHELKTEKLLSEIINTIQYEN